MEITLDEIKRLEKLSALSSSEEKLTSMMKDFAEIANFVEQVKSFDDQSDIEYSRVLDIAELRKDDIKPSMPQAEVLANAPEQGEGAFVVPKVVE